MTPLPQRSRIIEMLPFFLHSSSHDDRSTTFWTGCQEIFLPDTPKATSSTFPTALPHIHLWSLDSDPSLTIARPISFTKTTLRFPFGVSYHISLASDTPVSLVLIPGSPCSLSIFTTPLAGLVRYFTPTQYGKQAVHDSRESTRSSPTTRAVDPHQPGSTPN